MKATIKVSLKKSPKRSHHPMQMEPHKNLLIEIYSTSLTQYLGLLDVWMGSNVPVQAPGRCRD